VQCYHKTVNGYKSIFKKLPKIKQPKEKTEYVANLILEHLGDTHSERFYLMIAARVPEQVIHQVLSEIKADGAIDAPKLFTHKMKSYALNTLKKTSL